jgi:hypothetical protein
MDPPVLGGEDYEWVRSGGRGRGRGRGRGSPRDDRAYNNNSHEMLSYQNRPASAYIPDYQNRFNTSMHYDDRESRQNYYHASGNPYGNYYYNNDVSRYQYHSNNQGSSQYPYGTSDNRYNRARYSDNYHTRGTGTNSTSTSSHSQHFRFDRHQDKYRRDHSNQ